MFQGVYTALVTPFKKGDFNFFLNHNTFIDSYTPYYRFLNYEFYDHFQKIFEKDLNYSIEKLRGDGSWADLWINVDENVIHKWIKEYKVTHLIREKNYLLDFPIIYNNQNYILYDLQN